MAFGRGGRPSNGRSTMQKHRARPATTRTPARRHPLRTGRLGAGGREASRPWLCYALPSLPAPAPKRPGQNGSTRRWTAL